MVQWLARLANGLGLIPTRVLISNLCVKHPKWEVQMWPWNTHIFKYKLLPALFTLYFKIKSLCVLEVQSLIEKGVGVI